MMTDESQPTFAIQELPVIAMGREIQIPGPTQIRRLNYLIEVESPAPLPESHPSERVARRHLVRPVVRLEMRLGEDSFLSVAGIARNRR